MSPPLSHSRFFFSPLTSHSRFFFCPPASHSRFFNITSAHSSPSPPSSFLADPRMDGSRCLVQLSAHPNRGMMDEKITIVVQRAPPGLQLTVRSLHPCEDGHSWEAFGHYMSDSTGAVDGTSLSSSWKVVKVSHVRTPCFSLTDSLTRPEPGRNLFWGGTDGTAVEP